WEETESTPRKEQELLDDQVGGLANQPSGLAKKNHESIISSTGLTNPYKDKQFIKTADLNFRVDDVYLSTVAIEAILIANEGFLINSNLYADVYQTATYDIGNDSLMKVEEFQTRNNITLRIPNENMHESLLQIAEEIEFLNSRVLSADDVGLKLLAEELAQKRNAQSASNLQKSVNAGGKLDDKVYAESIAFERAREKDISLLKELSIEDQITYSTITLAIYQGPELSAQRIPNLEAFKAPFKKPYSRELMEAFSVSIDGIKSMIKFAVTIWPIFFLFFLGVVAYRKLF
ncbi:MAG: hypothetical protein ACI9QR_002083, partial [Flavobacteriaceae bacterium]